MADTTTTVLGLVKQTIGGNRNTWGGILNACMDLIEGAFYGITAKVVTGGSYSLTESERRKRILYFTGTLTEAQIIVIPNLVGRWTVMNATSGEFALSFKTTSGTATVIPQGGHCDVWCDGADGVNAGLSSRMRDTQALAPSGTLAAPGQSWAAEIASGLYRISAGVFAYVIGGVARLRIEAAVFKVILGSAVEVVSATDTGVNFGVPLTVQGETPTPIGAGMVYDGLREPNGWKFRNGQALSRTTHAALFAVLTDTALATRNGTATLASVSKDFTGLGLEGAFVEGTGIATGTTISSLTSNSITLSATPTGTGEITIRIAPHGLGDGSTTFNVPDDKGRVNPGRDNMGGTSSDRLTGQTGGINGDRLSAVGGSETVTTLQGHLPNVTLTTTIGAGQGSHIHNTDIPWAPQISGSPGGGVVSVGGATTVTSNAATLPAMSGTTALGGSATPMNNVMPSRITNKIIFTGVYT